MRWWKHSIWASLKTKASVSYNILYERNDAYSEMHAVARADYQLFAEFSSDVIQDGEKWKIHLGRRIYLHQNDPDGSIFMEEFLEEVMRPVRDDQWETVKEGDTWVTRPVAAAIVVDANGDYTGGPDYPGAKDWAPYDEGPLLLWDDYEEDEIDEEDDGDLESFASADSSEIWTPEKTQKESDENAADDEEEGAGQLQLLVPDDTDYSSEPGSDWDSNDGIE